MAQRLRVCVWDSDNVTRNAAIQLLNRLEEYQAIEYRGGTSQLGNLVQLKPNVVLVDIDNTISKESLVELRGLLSEVVIIGLSKNWTKDKREAFLSIGIDGCLANPFDIEDFIKIITDTSSVLNASNCKVLTFFSPKGKSGRTTLIVNLALALARVSGEKVAIIDADTGFADMDAFLNLKSESTIVEALRDLNYLTPGTIQRYFAAVTDKVQLMCGAANPEVAGFIIPEEIAKLINLAKNNFKYILVDLAQGFNPVAIAACEAADYVYLTNMAGSAYENKHLKNALEIFRSLDNWEERVSCVISRMKPDRERQKALEDEFACPVILIPNEYHLCSQAANNGRMALDIGPEAPLTKEINAWAEQLVAKER